MPEILRFGPPKDSIEKYADGTEVPHRHSPILRQHEDGTLEEIGYAEIHAHRVKIDESDLEDVSIGVTVRINPKRPI